MGSFSRNKTPDIIGGSVFPGESPWIAGSGSLFGRNTTPDSGFVRNVTPDVGGGSLFVGMSSGALSSGRKLQEVLVALSSLHTVANPMFLSKQPLFTVHEACAVTIDIYLQNDCTMQSSGSGSGSSGLAVGCGSGGDELPVQGSGLAAVDDDVLDEQVHCTQ
jgi:hypothetical protein